MNTYVSWILIGTAAGLICYTYVLYPALLRVVGRLRPAPGRPAPPTAWPLVSITVPAYNEEGQIRGLLDNLLSLDYPADRRQVLVVSDASSDRTDQIVREYADRGVQLLRLEQRSGKTAAENAARPHLRGAIVVNTDASIRFPHNALKPLIAWFEDPRVGVVSGRDVSVSRRGGDANAGESGYVGYEMTVRTLENRVYGIIGASGCFYAIRAHLHGLPLPDSLSRDFAAALHAREHGYRAISEDDAVCYVPRATSLQREYRRKVRTMTRGMETLLHKRHLLDPFRYGVFSWMLFSHKVCRWLVPWALLVLGAGLVLLAVSEPWARLAVAAAAVGLGLSAVGWWWPEERTTPKLFAIPAYLVTGNVAALHASLRTVGGDQNPIWEPTRRDAVAVR